MMTNEVFNRILKERIEKIKSVLASKANEYAREDRLSNFKRAAAMMKVTPERALLGMMAKHWVSVIDMIDDIEADRYHLIDTWAEKIGDSINYLILLEAMAIERRANTPSCVMDKKGK